VTQAIAVEHPRYQVEQVLRQGGVPDPGGQKLA
jgi:hypothetical protein